MKKFILKIISFGLLFLTLFLICFTLPATPRASKSLLFSNVKKDSLLKNTISPRLILVGGSNLSFGINSETIKDSLKINPINTAIHANIGLQYMMDNTLKHIKEGDIVLLTPEYNHFYGSYIYGRGELLRIVTQINFLDFFKLKNKQILSVLKYIPKYSLSKLNPLEYIGFREHDIYSVSSFNEYGDVYTHWGMKQREFPTANKIKERYNSNSIKLINEFRIGLVEKGASLFISYPCYQASSFDKNIKQIKKIQKELKKNNFKILGTPERYRMDDSLMFNTPYHLLKKGVNLRTKLLIEDLKINSIIN